MTKTYKEKCIACNGRGTEQKFNGKRWVMSEHRCNYCQGYGARDYHIWINGKNFCKQKVYI